MRIGEGEGDGEEGADGDNESVEGTTDGELDGDVTDGELKSETSVEPSLSATPEPEIILEPQPIEEPQPPSPAPEELWSYLKDTVCANNPVTVDELVEKLVNTVSCIPQPYLKSVVKESIKKQKSIEEDDLVVDGVEKAQTAEAAEGATQIEGEVPAEGVATEGVESAAAIPAEIPAQADATSAIEGSPDAPVTSPDSVKTDVSDPSQNVPEAPAAPPAEESTQPQATTETPSSEPVPS